MTQEQKVRTREEIETEMQKLLVHGVRGPNAAWSDVHRLFDEIRAYGATEERGKGAEVEAIYMWRPRDSGPWYDCTQDRASQEMHKRILYTRPANIAALEARVRELEEENARLKTPQFYGHDEEENGSDDISTFFDDCEEGEILKIDGYRRVNTKWVLWDGHSPHIFDTEDEARAALKKGGSA